MTTTLTQQQVRALQQEAAEAAARFAEAEAAKDERVTAALKAEADWRFRERTSELAAARNTAEAEASDVLTKPDSTLEELWQAFAAWRITSGVHFAHARANAANADNVLGTRTSSIGADIARPRPAVDAAGSTTFTDFLERHIENQTGAASRAEDLTILEREARVTAQAEKG